MYLHMLQSSSPSYVLMAGIDECIRMLEERAGDVFQQYTWILEKTRNSLKELRNLKLIEAEMYDISKIVVSAAGCVDKKENKKFTGKYLYNYLNEKYFLQMEMAAASYIVAMTSPADTGEGMKRLVSALYEIDGKLAKYNENERFSSEKNGRGKAGKNEQVCTPGQAMHLENRERIPFEECGGRVALEYAYIYPPGIPLIVPGEKVSAETAGLLRRYGYAGLRIEGTKRNGEIEVLTDG